MILDCLSGPLKEWYIVTVKAILCGLKSNITSFDDMRSERFVLALDFTGTLKYCHANIANIAGPGPPNVNAEAAFTT